MSGTEGVRVTRYHGDQRGEERKRPSLLFVSHAVHLQLFSFIFNLSTTALPSLFIYLHVYLCKPLLSYVIQTLL
ncbi:hypothetical protein XELAEV_18012096mg [Xenopus laevis]|uniref:Uncharacterized protein n=1 Tax=Xenopus laevis TaxID=8355 RepID=A0A974DNG0_XENLA|nr:hypothetical protein XELAEV_18012096mg [Xenopus laevis]